MVITVRRLCDVHPEGVALEETGRDCGRHSCCCVGEGGYAGEEEGPQAHQVEE